MYQELGVLHCLLETGATVAGATTCAEVMDLGAKAAKFLQTILSEVAILSEMKKLTIAVRV